MAQATTPQRTSRRTGCLTIIVLFLVVAAVISVTSSSGGGSSSTTPPAAFSDTPDQISAYTSTILNNDSNSPGVKGTPRTTCGHGPTGFGCTVRYTLNQPTGISTDFELIEPTRPIWKALFSDARLQSATMAVYGPVTSVGGKSSDGPLFTLSCDRAANDQIDWANVTGSGMRQLCTFDKIANGL